MLSDKLRVELNNGGVQLDDKTHTFTLSDGRTGSYALKQGKDVGESSTTLAMGMPNFTVGYIANTGEFQGYFDALRLARQRQEVRQRGDDSEATRMKLVLSQMGVECDDSIDMFQFHKLQGSYDLQKVGLHEIQMIALEREEARKKSDYRKGDIMREWLVTQGVQIDDKNHSFTFWDGTVGSYDLSMWRQLASN